MVQLNFNAATVAPAGSFTVYDSGIYDVMISGSEMKETKAKIAGTAMKGSYIQLNYRIVGGPHAGGTIIDRVNYENDNPTAEEIGQAQLSAICRVCNVMQLQDTQQLHGIPFRVEISKGERNDKPGQFSNEVKGYQNMQGQTPDAIGSAGAAPAQQQHAAPPPVQQAAPPVQQPVTAPPVQQQQPPVQQPAPTAPPVETAPPVQQQPPVEQQQPPVQQPPVQQQQPPAATTGAAPPPWAQQNNG